MSRSDRRHPARARARVPGWRRAALGRLAPLVGLGLAFGACGGGSQKGASAADTSRPREHLDDCAWYDTSEVASTWDASTRDHLRSVCELESEFHHFVDARRACSTDDDCAVVPTACPFGCGVVANTAKAGEIQARHDTLKDRYHVAASDCDEPCEPPKDPHCEGGRCAPE